jgi:hypothetical protein
MKKIKEKLMNYNWVEKENNKDYNKKTIKKD